MGKRARWILLSVGLLAVVGFGWAKLRRGHEPVARFPLPDGTELRLEQVTYGTHHVMPEAGKLLGWLTQKAAPWSLGRIEPRLGEYTIKTRSVCPVVWFSCYDPRTRKFVEPPKFNVPLLEPGSFTQNFPFDRYEVYPKMAFMLESYDRRLPTFRMRVDAQGKTFYTELPNPATGITFPKWQPEPLPQTRRLGRFEITLRSIYAESEGYASPIIFPDLEFRDTGGADDGRVISFEWSDATGNFIQASDGMTYSLPLQEPAWKLRVKFIYDYDGAKAKGGTVEFIVAPPKLPEPKSEPNAR